MNRLNILNKPVTLKVIEGIFKKNGTDIVPKDLDIYQTAFIHKSYVSTNLSEEACKGYMPLQSKSNETYEFLGDTVLNSIIGIYLYEKYSHMDEGFLTKTRTKMVRGTTLGKLAQLIGLDEWVVISQHVETEGGRSNLRILEDLFESFLGAIYLDQNSFEACQKFVINVYENHINLTNMAQYDDNYKDQLQTVFQRLYGMFPKWELLATEGNRLTKTHTIGIRNPHGNIIGLGKERKKIEAEQAASKNALIGLGVLPEDYGENFFN